MIAFIESLNIIAIFIAICAVAMVALVFRRQVKKVSFVVLNSVVGLAAAFLINFAAAPLGFVGIGINFVNALVIGVLGIPGLVTLYAAAWLL